MCDELLFGVVGPPVIVREDRAVKGAGALIIDFFGVSKVCLLLRLLLRLDDEAVDLEVTIVEDALSFRPAVTNGCLSAACGFILRSGSQTRHFDIKSTNSSSLHFNTCCSVFVPGRRLRPLELTTARGVPFNSIVVSWQRRMPKIQDTPKNSFLRELLLTNSLSGTPRTSMMQDSCSCSFSPGKIGKPVYNSARIQPKLHMSIAI